jgi:hypothetical protein
VRELAELLLGLRGARVQVVEPDLVRRFSLDRGPRGDSELAVHADELAWLEHSPSGIVVHLLTGGTSSSPGREHRVPEGICEQQRGEQLVAVHPDRLAAQLLGTLQALQRRVAMHS